jgi:hypothetical protein
VYDTEGNKKELRLYQEKIDISTRLKMRSGVIKKALSPQ